MSKFKNILIIFVIFQIIYSLPNCIEKQNNCQKCNPLTNLCIKCQADNYFPDEDGGCQPKCNIGKNYCNLCDEDQKLCILCEEGYYPDKIGGCSYITNCETSYKGKCLTCIEDFMLIQETGICKSINSEDLKNCLTISKVNGTCLECKDGYFLNEGDFKCSDTEFCYESTYGICTSCIEGYYINKKNDKCEKLEILNCKQTVDGINCDKCNDNFYLTENYQCIDSNFCSEAKDGKCIKCVEKYFLVEDSACTFDQNCVKADLDSGTCTQCKLDHYFDDINKVCKSNKEDEEFIHCKKATKSCVECEEGYFLGGDSKCSNSQNCAESEKTKCLECNKNYFLAEDGKCTNVEHCIKVKDNFESPCEECENGYYLNVRYYKCLKVENETFLNCKKAQFFGNICQECKKNYYNNKTDYLCYDNTDENSDFYKCKETDIYGEECYQCEEGYFLGSDKKCTITDECKLSGKNNKCIECKEGYCLDVKNEICVDSEFLDDINLKIYISCKKTNEEGTKCEECLDGYVVGEEGYCIDVDHCEKKEGEICTKCKEELDENDYPKYYCYNSVFGCVRTHKTGCLKCEDLEYLFMCTECEPGYKLTIYGECRLEF